MNIEKPVKFLSQWVVVVIILLIVSGILKNNVVLGNDKVAGSMAAVLNGLILTAIYFMSFQTLIKTSFWKSLWSSLDSTGLKIKKENQLIVGSLLINVVVIWLIKRLAMMTGLGISNIFWVLLLAFLVTLGQWATDKVLESTL